MGVTITQSGSSASRTGSGQSHDIALMATKKSPNWFRWFKLASLTTGPSTLTALCYYIQDGMRCFAAVVKGNVPHPGRWWPSEHHGRRFAGFYCAARFVHVMRAARARRRPPKPGGTGAFGSRPLASLPGGNQSGIFSSRASKAQGGPCADIAIPTPPSGLHPGMRNHPPRMVGGKPYHRGFGYELPCPPFRLSQRPLPCAATHYLNRWPPSRYCSRC